VVPSFGDFSPSPLIRATPLFASVDSASGSSFVYCVAFADMELLPAFRGTSRITVFFFLFFHSKPPCSSYDGPWLLTFLFSLQGPFCATREAVHFPPPPPPPPPLTIGFSFEPMFETPPPGSPSSLADGGILFKRNDLPFFPAWQFPQIHSGPPPARNQEKRLIFSPPVPASVAVSIFLLSSLFSTS